MKGRRSYVGGLMFEKSGSNNVHHYEGGWKGWNEHWTKEQWQDWHKQTGYTKNNLYKSLLQNL